MLRYGQAVVVLTLVNVFSLTIAAQRELCPEALTNSAMVECMAKEVSKAEAELEQYYAEAKRVWRDDSEVIHALESSQQAWEAFRKSACHAVVATYGRGSGGPLEGLGCMLVGTERRIYDLWSYFLAHDLTTKLAAPKERSCQ